MISVLSKSSILQFSVVVGFQKHDCAYINIAALMPVKYKQTQDDISFLFHSGCLWTLTIIQAINLDKYASGELENSRKPLEAEFVFDEIKDQSKPYAFQTHLRYRMLPSETATKNVKIIYISRNPKDVVVSGFHFMKKIGFAKDWTWDDYFEKFCKDLQCMALGLITEGTE